MNERPYRVDFHIHSHFSDAMDWHYKNIVFEAIVNGIKLIAITDHDVITNVPLLHEKCAGNDISFITGVEFSTILDGNLHHILGYGFNWLDEGIVNLANGNIMLEAQRNNNKDDFCIRFLIDAGYTINWDEYLAFEGGAKTIPGYQFRSKAHSFLIETGICKDRKDFFERLYPLMRGTTISKLPDFPHPGEVINIIKAAGGVPVLAHPAHRNNKLSLADTLELFKMLTIAGIECFMPNNNDEATDACLNFCKSYKLFITGGSDFHGRIGTKIGTPVVMSNECNLIRALQSKIYQG